MGFALFACAGEAAARQCKRATAETQLNEAKAQLHAGQSRAAAAKYRRCLRIDSGCLPCRHGLGWALWAQADWQGTIREWEQVLKEQPEHEVILRFLPRARASRDWEAAEIRPGLARWVRLQMPESLAPSDRCPHRMIEKHRQPKLASWQRRSPKNAHVPENLPAGQRHIISRSESGRLDETTTMGADLMTPPFQAFEGHADDLAAIRAVLTKAQKKEGITRLAFWGASHVEADHFTGRVRQILQSQYGDGGHGFLLPARPLTYYRGRDVELCSTAAWRGDYVKGQGSDTGGLLGMGGATVTSGDPEQFGWLQTTRKGDYGRSVSRFDLHLLHQPGGGGLLVQMDNQEPIRLTTAGEALQAALYQIEIKDGHHRLMVRPVGDAPVTILGASMERDGPGVVVDAMGIRGRTASTWLHFEPKLQAALLSSRMPDLAVLAYGTNEANMRSLTHERYRAQLTQTLGRMRQLMPKTPCLLIGPSDRAVRDRQGRWRTWIPTYQVAQIQREIAPEFGCGFWDLALATGGPDSMAQWVVAEPRLGNRDRIHFTRAGYEVLAEHFVRALETEAVPLNLPDPRAEVDEPDREAAALRFAAGKRYQERQLHAAAAALFARACQKDPAHLEAIFEWARSLTLSGRHQDALTVLGSLRQANCPRCRDLLARVRVDADWESLRSLPEFRALRRP